MTGKAPSAASCAKCGAAASGRFCTSCGTALEPVACARCGGTVPAASKFCPECGQATSATAAKADRRNLVPWAIGAGLLVVILALVARQESGNRPDAAPTAPLAGAGEAGTPPDISQMTPRERFDRLYNRVMQASEAGDTATVAQFTPMALMAYADLDQVDADARYHAAMLRMHTGDNPGAAALADSILIDQPGHLFGWLIRGALARFGRNDAALSQAQADFLRNYEAESAAGRPEYADHKTALDRFKAQAEGKPAP